MADRSFELDPRRTAGLPTTFGGGRRLDQNIGQAHDIYNKNRSEMNRIYAERGKMYSEAIDSMFEAYKTYNKTQAEAESIKALEKMKEVAKTATNAENPQLMQVIYENGMAEIKKELEDTRGVRTLFSHNDLMNWFEKGRIEGLSGVFQASINRSNEIKQANLMKVVKEKLNDPLVPVEELKGFFEDLLVKTDIENADFAKNAPWKSLPKDKQEAYEKTFARGYLKREQVIELADASLRQKSIKTWDSNVMIMYEGNESVPGLGLDAAIKEINNPGYKLVSMNSKGEIAEVGIPDEVKTGKTEMLRAYDAYRQNQIEGASRAHVQNAMTNLLTMDVEDITEAYDTIINGGSVKGIDLVLEDGTTVPIMEIVNGTGRGSIFGNYMSSNDTKGQQQFYYRELIQMFKRLGEPSGGSEKVPDQYHTLATNFRSYLEQGSMYIHHMVNISSNAQISGMEKTATREFLNQLGYDPKEMLGKDGRIKDPALDRLFAREWLGYQQSSAKLLNEGIQRAVNDNMETRTSLIGKDKESEKVRNALNALLKDHIARNIKAHERSSWGYNQAKAFLATLTTNRLLERDLDKRISEDYGPGQRDASMAIREVKDLHSRGLASESTLKQYIPLFKKSLSEILKYQKDNFLDEGSSGVDPQGNLTFSNFAPVMEGKNVVMDNDGNIIFTALMGTRGENMKQVYLVAGESLESVGPISLTWQLYELRSGKTPTNRIAAFNLTDRMIVKQSDGSPSRYYQSMFSYSPESWIPSETELSLTEEIKKPNLIEEVEYAGAEGQDIFPTYIEKIEEEEKVVLPGGEGQEVLPGEKSFVPDKLKYEIFKFIKKRVPQ